LTYDDDPDGRTCPFCQQVFTGKIRDEDGDWSEEYTQFFAPTECCDDNVWSRCQFTAISAEMISFFQNRPVFVATSHAPMMMISVLTAAGMLIRMFDGLVLNARDSNRSFYVHGL
jgi:hypothetical protein